MKPIIMTCFDYVDGAEKYANERYLEGYKLISFSSYKDIRGVVFVVCMELAKFNRVGDSE